jgi:alpha-methylacyl-CoA racemase
MSTSRGPLTGFRILEFAGIGPGPMCGMLLADLGADVVRIDRKKANPNRVVKPEDRFDITGRSKRSAALDLKKPEAIETCLKLMESADAIIDVYRPGVMERLGLGPEIALQRNPTLVYGRMTGWGQTGTYAHAPGHDINYIAISGALACMGPKDRPMAPINLVGDYGGGALYLAFGLLAGILCARNTGQGQVIDCAMADGAASLMATCYGMYAAGLWRLGREDNILDGARPSYGTYQCSDGKWITIGSSEPPFYRKLREITGFLDDPEFDLNKDRAHWPSLRAKLAERFKTRTQAEWCALMDGSEACFAPVLDMSEAPGHHHNQSRQVFVEIDGVVQPAPAPRFSATPGAIHNPPPSNGEHTQSALKEWGISAAELDQLRASGGIQLDNDNQGRDDVSTQKKMGKLQGWLFKRVGRLMGRMQSAKYLKAASSGEKYPILNGRDICVVSMKGAKSGKLRRVPVMYVPYQKGVLLVASLGGAPEMPSWYYNLMANPDIDVQVREKNLKLRARLASAEEKKRLWPVCVEHYPDYQVYQDRCIRDIPVFVCEPR